MSNYLQESDFSIELPPGFEVRRDDEGVTCVCAEPGGVLTITSEPVDDPEDLPNLSRMLAGFLTRSGHPVATDELLRMTDIPGAQGFSWQYTEDERYFRFWLFGTLQCWVLLTFVCPSSARSHFHEGIQSAIKTLRLRTERDAATA